MEGRTMLVLLAPSKGVAKKKEKGEQPEGRTQPKSEKEAEAQS
jgi:hypothetical protein